MIDLVRKSLEQSVGGTSLADLLSKRFPEMLDDERAQTLPKIAAFLLEIPAAMETINCFASHPACGRATKFAYGEILCYCFDEDDLMPESTWGLLGLLDDAYLLLRFADLLRAYFPYVALVENLASSTANFEVVTRLLKPEITDALDRTAHAMLDTGCALFLQKAEVFHSATA